MSLLSCVLAHKDEDILNKLLKPLVDTNFKGQGKYLTFLCKSQDNNFFYVMMVNVTIAEMEFIYEKLTDDFLYRDLKYHFFPMKDFNQNRILDEVKKYFII